MTKWIHFTSAEAAPKLSSLLGTDRNMFIMRVVPLPININRIILIPEATCDRKEQPTIMILSLRSAVIVVVAVSFRNQTNLIS